MASSSSDSDSSDRVKNIHSVLIKFREEENEEEQFANDSYKRKLGNLIFDAAYEGGNLGFVEKVDRYNFDLMVRPDVANPRHRLWFNFRISNQLPKQCVIFNFVNLSDYVRAFHEGLTPVVRSRSRPNWIRLDENQVFYHRSQNHGMRFILSIAFRFSTHEDEHQFALFYPYDLTMLSSLISRWTVEIKRRSKLDLNQEKLKISRSSSSSSVMNSKQIVVTPKKQKSGKLTSSHNQLTLGSLSPGSNAPMINTSDIDITNPTEPYRCSSSMSFLAYERNQRGKNKFKKVDDHQNPSIKHQQQLLLAKTRFEYRILTTSILSKPIYHVTIGNQFPLSSSSLEKAVTSKHSFAEVCKPIVVFICRPGGNLDSVSSYVCQGALDYALSKTLIGSCVRCSMQLEVIPMLDVDSVCVGNSQTDILGQPNHPRKLMRTLKPYYSNLTSVRNVIESLVLKTKTKQCFGKANESYGGNGKGINECSCRVILLEMRVNMNLIGSRIIGYNFDDNIRMERHLSFPRTLSRFCESFYLENCQFLEPSSSTKFSFNFKTNELVDHYRFEISTHAAYKRKLDEIGYEPYDQIKYLSVGKAIIYSLLDLLKGKDRQFEYKYEEKQTSRGFKRLTMRLPDEVLDTLKSFHENAHDIDHLKLTMLHN